VNDHRFDLGRQGALVGGFVFFRKIGGHGYIVTASASSSSRIGPPLGAAQVARGLVVVDGLFSHLDGPYDLCPASRA